MPNILAAKRAVRRALPAWLLYRYDMWKALRAARRSSRAAPAGRRPNPLSALLIVSLTSFPPRFATLHLTLESLLNQTTAPDRVVLWIARGDLPRLPRRVSELEHRGLDIRACDDAGSYKKLIFALNEWPDAFIATADDDLFYPPDWLESMVTEAAQEDAGVILCHRAHRVTVEGVGRLAAYDRWELDVQDARARSPSTDIVPTTGAGVLYPPNSLSAEVTDRRRIEELCPTADDLWFYWMARRAGSKVRKVGPRFPMIEWPSARVSSLWDANREGGNDRQVRNLEQVFGSPLS